MSAILCTDDFPPRQATNIATKPQHTNGQIISLVPNNKTSVSCSKRKRTVPWACICLVRSEITKKGKSEI